MKKKTSSNYRIVVSIFLLISFISPWMRAYSDIFPFGPPIIVNGLHELIGIFWMYTQPDLVKDSLSDIRIIGFDILIATGLIIILIYSISNFYLGIRHRGYVVNRNKSLRNIVLLFLSMYSVINSISYSMNSRIAWGSWAMVVGLGFAISIEIVNTLNLVRDA